jgi:hypothetical protein
MKSVVRKLGGLILGLTVLCGAAISSSAATRYWHGHYRVYYSRPVYVYPRRYVYYYPRGYYYQRDYWWHRHHSGWWHHRDWD